MFGFLKKKIDDFVSKITKKTEEKLETQPSPAEPAPLPAQQPVAQPEESVPTPASAPEEPAQTPAPVEPVRAQPVEEKPAELVAEKPSEVFQQVKISKPAAPPAKPAPEPSRPEPQPRPEPQLVKPSPAPAKPPAPALQPTRPPAPPVVKPQPSQPVKPQPVQRVVEEKPAQPKKGIADKILSVFKPAPAPTKPAPSLITEIKKAVVGEARLSPQEVDDFVWDFSLALLEGDVAHDVADAICTEIKQKLAARAFRKSEDIPQAVQSIVKSAVRDVLVDPAFDLVAEIKKAEKPVVIMFLGPNGAGKTTTIAKFAVLLRKHGLTSVFAAGDTFRAASIEQLEEHARRVGVRVVKQQYGSDPAAVAFDAISAAKAAGIDCVLIDTAGRQETNRNLMEELKKIARVAKPRFKIYLDEALAGNVLVERVSHFKEAIGLDGVVLSKMDVDVKGGGTISIARATGVPILFFGTGQGYDDLQPFDREEVVSRIFAS
jgi:fused signal recognition particle receptor